MKINVSFRLFFDQQKRSYWFIFDQLWTLRRALPLKVGNYQNLVDFYLANELG